MRAPTMLKRRLRSSSITEFSAAHGVHPGHDVVSFEG
jgi:hypothetical protein